jgi:hypothetical protein
LNEIQQKFCTNPEKILIAERLLREIDPSVADLAKGHRYEHGYIDFKQDYEVVAKYFAKAASQKKCQRIV